MNPLFFDCFVSQLPAGFFSSSSRLFVIECAKMLLEQCAGITKTDKDKFELRKVS
jgi:hypothetical protein